MQNTRGVEVLALVLLRLQDCGAFRYSSAAPARKLWDETVKRKLAWVSPTFLRGNSSAPTQ